MRVLGLAKESSSTSITFPVSGTSGQCWDLWKLKSLFLNASLTLLPKTQGSEPLSLCHGTSTSPLCCSWGSRDLGSHPRLWEGGFALARKGLGVQDQGKREGNPIPKAGSL